MSEIRDKVNYELLQILDDCKSADEERGFNFLPYIKRITDIPELAIVDREAELPEGVFDYEQHKRIFKEAGWVKEVKK